MRVRPGAFLAIALALALSTPLQAQQGTVQARVTDAATARPLPSVQVSVTGTEVRTGGITDQNGRLDVRVAPGTYTVTFQLIGYETESVESVEVTAGGTTPVNVTMRSGAVTLQEMVITADRQLQKKTDAPATVSVVSEQTIEERPATTPVQHLYNTPGVDIITQGMQSTNVVVRGFNNIFSGALHALTDNRIAGIPSLRVNLIHFVPAMDDDIARMEVVLGPGSALYGPNTANGVLHIITKSPLSEQGTTLALAGGERDVFKGMFRTSHLLSDDFGLKISGQLFRGIDWRFHDPAEIEAEQQVQATRQQLEAMGLPPAAVNAELARRLGLPPDEAELALSRLGNRDFQIQRWSGEVRGDWRVGDDATWVFQAGATGADGIELTGIGAGQTQDWIYSYYQTRFQWNRLFAQLYLNKSDAGDTYLVRQGAPLVDNSELVVGQLQHGFGLGELMSDGKNRQDFTYGLDVFLTTPKTEGRINGQYEDDDEIDEVGGYIQSQTALSDRWDLIAAARLDESSVLDDPVFSPRAALVFRPDENQSFRFTFNRAFSTPTTLNYFLDINAGLTSNAQLAQLGFFTRAMGAGTEGLSFQNADGSLTGIRSPFTPDALGGPGTLLPADPTILWQFAVGVLQQLGQLSPQQVAALLAMDVSNVGLDLLNPVDGTTSSLEETVIPDTPPLEESITETWELGYQGVLGNKVSLSADVWYTQRDNFTSPLIPRTPLVLLDGEDVGQALVQQLGATPQEAALLAGALASLPLGVVSSSDVVTETPDIVASYVNFGDVDMWGWDAALKAFLTDRWTLEATASWVSEDFFVVDPETDEEVEDPVFGEDFNVNQLLALNAPDFKGSVTLGYREPESGFTGESRVRFNSEFPVNAADFVGLGCLEGFEAGQGQIRECVESNAVVDLLLGYRFEGTGMEAQLNVQNVFDNKYRNFVGVPEIGRLAMLQLKYSF